jgi:hypothetical protein
MSNYGQVYATAPKNSIAGAKQRRARKYAEDKPMKRTFKQRFKEWLFDDGPVSGNDDICIDEDSIQLSRERSIKFEIHNANGGRVVQTRRYDAQKDRHFENLYVITSDQDFGRELDKIITMEALR